LIAKKSKVSDLFFDSLEGDTALILYSRNCPEPSAKTSQVNGGARRVRLSRKAIQAIALWWASFARK
jgi:hypothetical protein